jgi:hypothetical protein
MRIIEGNGGKFNGHKWDCNCYDCAPDTDFTNAYWDSITAHNNEVRAKMRAESDAYWAALRADDIETALIYHENADKLRKQLK